MSEKHYEKYVFFKSEEEAKRFEKLYDAKFGIHEMNDDGFYNDFYRRYFGEKANGMYMIFIRITTDEFNKMIKDLGLKKKRWNGHLCYLYE